MIIPVRCFTCGRVVGSAYPEYVKRVSMGEDPKAVLDDLGFERYCCRRMKAVLDDLGFERYCCRRMIVSHADLIGEIAPLG